SSTTRAPRSASNRAAVLPAGPAPTTTIGDASITSLWTAGHEYPTVVARPVEPSVTDGGIWRSDKKVRPPGRLGADPGSKRRLCAEPAAVGGVASPRAEHSRDRPLQRARGRPVRDGGDDRR